MPRPQTHAEVVEVIERHVDEAHRRVLRSTTDPARTLPRIKKKAEQAQDERVLDVLLALLGEVHAEALTSEQLRTQSYNRIDGRSEERRVGKESRCGSQTDLCKS